jgi:outer membrane receptor protein involved in Fe transport
MDHSGNPGDVILKSIGRISMKVANLKSCASVMALGLALVASPAFAQDAAATAADEEATSSLDEIVVTASGRDQTKINTSVSVTSVDAQMIQDFHPSSEAEVFKLLPGIQVPGTSGPGGNSNIAVRGLPVATGGAPFVQLQEDGLPVVLFGDIQFGNNDYWTKFDATTANVEAVRGGSATTFASQAPGAVINYISHYGNKEGGMVELNRGLGFDETQVNFRYGGPVNDGLRFNIGGFVRGGKGPRDAGYNLSKSVQIKANVTKDLGEKGYFRMLFKFADTQEPNWTGAPAFANVSGTTVSNIRPYTNFDGRDQSNYSALNQSFLIVNNSGVLERVKMTGISTKQKSLGAELHYEIADNITIDNKARYSDMSGSFNSPFLGLTGLTNTTPLKAGMVDVCSLPPAGQSYDPNGVIGSCVNGSIVTAIRNASGPNAGALYTGTYVDNNVNVNTNMSDMGSFVNDLAVAGKWDAGGGTVTARAGYFYMSQNIAYDWHVNKSTRAVSGDSPTQLDLYAGATKLTNEGLSGYGNNWGDCCARTADLSYTNTAPYAQLVFDNDTFNLDGSIRFERVAASGRTQKGGAAFNVVSGGVTIPAIIANGASEVLDYSRSYNSWTAGALFKVTPSLSIFGRASRGGRFNADRQTVSNKFTGSGALCTTAQATALLCTDGVTPSVDFVKQYEIGMKNKGDLGGGRYTLELTLLKGNFTRSDYEPTSTARCVGGGCIIDGRYQTQGAEFFATYRNGGFSMVANATYTKAKQRGVVTKGGTIQSTSDSAFRRADGIPDLSYSLSGNYDAGMFGIGMTAVGQSSTLSGGLTYPGKTLFNGNISVSPIENLKVGLNAYNLFDTFDLRGNGAGLVTAAGANSVISGTPALGRTITGSVKFSF